MIPNRPPIIRMANAYNAGDVRSIGGLRIFIKTKIGHQTAQSFFYPKDSFPVVLPTSAQSLMTDWG